MNRQIRLDKIKIVNFAWLLAAFSSNFYFVLIVTVCASVSFKECQ